MCVSHGRTYFEVDGLVNHPDRAILVLGPTMEWMLTGSGAERG